MNDRTRVNLGSFNEEPEMCMISAKYDFLDKMNGDMREFLTLKK